MRATADVVVIGGGPAGAACAGRLAGSGLKVVLYERGGGLRHPVCGEFLSGTAAAELGELGLDLDAIGARRITRTRIVMGSREASGPLPFGAFGLSRRRLDAGLLDTADACGALVRTGTSVRALQRSGSVWTTTLASGERTQSPSVVLATGKHELRNHAREVPGDGGKLGFKMHYRLETNRAEVVGDAVELYPFAGGYAGLQLIESGIANLCLAIDQACFAGRGNAWRAVLAHLQEAAPALAARLEGASPLFAKPVSVARIPYGYMCPPTPVTDGLYRVGDQAAVIPSFAGEGMAIALRTARLAAAAISEGRSAGRYLRALHNEVKGAVRRARLIEMAMHRCGGPGLALIARVPPLLASLASGTRLPQIS